MQRLQEQVKKLQADAADEGRRRAQADTLELKVANLEEELQAAQRQCDQAIQKRDALLRQSEADLLQAREKIRSRAAEARGLEADLQRAKKEKRQREKECVSLKTQLLQLREQLKEAHTTCRDTGQELTRQQERVQMLEGGQHLAQEQLSERVAEVVRAEKAQRRLQADLKGITDSLENTQKELQDSRRLVERLRAEASSSRSDVLNAQHEVGRLQQEKQQILDELDISRETLSALQTKLCEQEKLINTHQTQLQLCRRQLETRKDQEQKQHQQMSSLQATVTRLKLDVEQEREKWRQGVREAAKADQRGRELRLELSTAQATHKEYMEMLAEYSGEVASQRSEQARLQQFLIQLTEEKKAQDERVTQMSADLERLHSESRSSEEKARASEARLAELHTQLSRSQQRTQEHMSVLRDREEEVLLLKMDMAALRENYAEKVSQVEALHSQMDSVDQKYNAAVCEVEVLRQCLGDARSDSSRLHRESELVVTNVNQWVKEQKHTNEKLALKIKDQSRKIIHLTAERDHLQENVKGLHGEIRRLNAERLKPYQRKASNDSRQSCGTRHAGKRGETDARIKAAIISARASEARLAELHTQLSRSQQRTQEHMSVLRDREEEVLLLKMDMAALRENYAEKVSQVEALHSQMDSVDQKYNAAVCEVEVLRQCLGDARSDSSRLHRESELVVTNVNQWVKEQNSSQLPHCSPLSVPLLLSRHTNEKLALKIKDQSRKIIHLTAERDHLQENVKGLHGEIRRLNAERLKVQNLLHMPPYSIIDDRERESEA
ncbi:trichohyalin-like [Pimephales promelas]|uniref:trichohyalin-like n=1 Tax=Pimephales promelas TaxID=90988 RepID=UPI001955A075|nr:trichohyalin-like [Pimephales promelas]